MKFAQCGTIEMPLICSVSSAIVYPHLILSELQAAVCVHSDATPFAQHSEGLLEAGAGLPLHVHRDAQRRRPGAGKTDLVPAHNFGIRHHYVIKPRKKGQICSFGS